MLVLLGFEKVSQSAVHLHQRTMLAAEVEDGQVYGLLEISKRFVL